MGAHRRAAPVATGAGSAGPGRRVARPLIPSVIEQGFGALAFAVWLRHPRSPSSNRLPSAPRRCRATTSTRRRSTSCRTSRRPATSRGRSPSSARASSRGDRFQTLLGITGSGKSATIAWTIENVQKPTLILAPNKSLAAQLAQEMREFFPHNRVEYFVSYYDYYQPEAYIASSDTYIEKDSSVNDEIDRLRHSATAALLTRRDVIVVASVSCIYGMGNPDEYRGQMIDLNVGVDYDQRSILRKLVDLQFDRNDIALGRGKFRVRGDTIEVHPSYEESVLRIEMFGDTIDRLTIIDPLTGETLRDLPRVQIFPATHYVTGDERMRKAVVGIEAELQERLALFETEGKLLEAQRLRMRTQYDLEMIQEVGYCNGIENYSMHIDGRTYGEPPFTLIDYFPDDFLLVVDESHQAVPQLHGQYEGDRSRKDQLVEHGFRLPSARDNRPLRFEEVLERINQAVFLSATPGPYELRVSEQVVEQVVRPTGLVDPEVVIKPTKGQIDDLITQVNDRVTRGDRVLITTLTKKMAEDLTDYLLEQGLRVRYLHSNVDTIQRIEILRGSTARRLRRARRDQPAPRRPRPPRGVAGRHPRCRQGRVPAQRDVARADDGPCRPQRRRPGDHVRRQDHRLDAAGPSTSPTAGVRCRSPTTPSTASTRRRSARPSATSSPCCGPTTRRRCRARTVAVSASATRCSAS